MIAGCDISLFYDQMLHLRAVASRRQLCGPARYDAFMPQTAQERAQAVRLIIFDVDGVLTDGGIWLFPAPAGGQTGQEQIGERLGDLADQCGYGIHSTTMVEAKGFNAHDGTGISLARLGGMKCALITKRVSTAVALRARDLRVEHLYMGQSRKMLAVQEILAKEQLTLRQIAYVGDDIIDLPVMRLCGLAIAVANARKEVKAVAHYVTPNSGGHGAARDAVEFILEAQGRLTGCIEQYVRERT